MNKNSNIKSPSAAVSFIPLATLVIFLAITINLFGGDAIAGGSQLSLLAATAVCTAIAIGVYRRKWSDLEDAIVKNMKSATPALLILLLIGMIGQVIPLILFFIPFFTYDANGGSGAPSSQTKTYGVDLVRFQNRR